jgi:hypothetical protein
MTEAQPLFVVSSLPPQDEQTVSKEQTAGFLERIESKFGSR